MGGTERGPGRFRDQAVTFRYAASAVRCPPRELGWETTVDAAPTPASSRTSDEVREVEVPLDRDLFLRALLRRLAGTLEDLVGLEETAGFVSVVGDEIGQLIDREYRTALGTERLDEDQVGAVLVDLKRRIEGDFRIVAQDEHRIELRNRACPFAEQVVGRPSLCMMTSNVFGSITANNLGYARVELLETIAEGDPGCHVVVHLEPSAEPLPGREYFGGIEPARLAEVATDDPPAAPGDTSAP
jgi:hypothetical protein